MASGSRSGVLDEADLHGLVDGRIDGERHAAILRRLATSPADRARVEAWQGQNDLLRNAFAGVEREPLPAILDLKATSRLQCIPANDAPLVEPPSDAGSKSAWRHVHLTALLATVLVIIAGLGGSWLLFDSFRAEAPTQTQAADVSIEAVAVTQTAAIAGGLDRLPTTEIPDLDAAGFNFVGAETASTPPMIVFRYQNGQERVAVSVSRMPLQKNASTSPTRTATGYSWHTRDKRFVIAGTPTPERLLEFALSLQKAALAE